MTYVGRQPATGRPVHSGATGNAQSGLSALSDDSSDGAGHTGVIQWQGDGREAT
jgi:hypothetical protein